MIICVIWSTAKCLSFKMKLCCLSCGVAKYALRQYFMSPMRYTLLKRRWSKRCSQISLSFCSWRLFFYFVGWHENVSGSTAMRCREQNLAPKSPNVVTVKRVEPHIAWLSWAASVSCGAVRRTSPLGACFQLSCLASPFTSAHGVYTGSVTMNPWAEST